MKLSVFGLGYVGTVSAGCLAQDGHQVIGVDLNPRKVEQVAGGRSPIIEPGLDELIAKAHQQGRLEATADGRRAVRESDVSLICVSTPSNGNGSLHYQHVENVCREIGAALGEKSGYHVVVVRSTVLAGTVRGRLIPILEDTSGRRAGPDFGVVMNPEFLRESTAVADYYHPGQVIIGQLDAASGDPVEELYQAVEAPRVRTSVETAEMLKYVNNAFHAVKVVFANEIGSFCKAHGIDGREVMELFCRDRRLNISDAYLRPGFAFGGSCLPKASPGAGLPGEAERRGMPPLGRRAGKQSEADRPRRQPGRTDRTHERGNPGAELQGRDRRRRARARSCRWPRPSSGAATTSACTTRWWTRPG